jgi:hypothetical protein
MLRGLICALAPLAGACSTVLVSVGDRPFTAIEHLFSPERAIAVESVGRSQHCGTDGSAARVTLFADAAAVLAWQASRNLQLLTERPLDLPHAVIELGARSTGGHGLAVSHAAGRRGDVVFLRVTTFSPAAAVSDAAGRPTAPCSLVRLPQGPWSGIEVYDQSGTIMTWFPQKS